MTSYHVQENLDRWFDSAKKHPKESQIEEKDKKSIDIPSEHQDPPQIDQKPHYRGNYAHIWTRKNFKDLTGRYPEKFVEEAEGRYPGDEWVRHYVSAYRNGMKMRDPKNGKKFISVIEPGDIYTLVVLYRMFKKKGGGDVY